MSEHQCGSHCHSHGDCHDCEHVEPNGCPNCERNGLAVEYETVYSLTKPIIKDQLESYKDSQFFLCTQRPCKVAYYTSEDIRIFTNQVTVPIWFKHDKEEYIVCYCRRITLNDIIESVYYVQDVSEENIVRYLNKEDVITDCKHNNPTGMCCDKLFDNAISYALKQKGINK